MRLFGGIVMAIKVGKGIGKLLAAAGLAREVPDGQEQPAPADETKRIVQNAGTPDATRRRGTRAGIDTTDKKAVPADLKIKETLKSALSLAQSADVYQLFKEHSDALTGFIEDEAQRTKAAAKAAKLTKAEIELALSARLKKLDAEAEKMRAEFLTDIRQELARGESELKQAADSIATKEQELKALRDRADSLNVQITSARQKTDETKGSIQAAYERLRLEIEAEQALVKRSLR
jgi:uncharacterized coiled-coil DUF342 family protein